MPGHNNKVWVNLFVDSLREKIDLVRGRLSHAEVVGVLELVKHEQL